MHRCGNTRRRGSWVRGGVDGPDVGPYDVLGSPAPAHRRGPGRTGLEPRAHGRQPADVPAGASLARTDTRRLLAAEQERRMQAEADGRLLAEKLRQQENELAAVCDALRSAFYTPPPAVCFPGHVA